MIPGLPPTTDQSVEMPTEKADEKITPPTEYCENDFHKRFGMQVPARWRITAGCVHEHIDTVLTCTTCALGLAYAESVGALTCRLCGEAIKVAKVEPL